MEKSLEKPNKLSHIVLEIGDEIVGYVEFGPFSDIEWFLTQRRVKRAKR